MSTDRRQIASDRRHGFTGQKLAQFRLAVPRKELTQILAGLASAEVLPKQPLDGMGNLGCEAPVSDRPRCRLMQAERASQAEIVRVDQAALDFHLLAIDANIGNPVLSATVGATGDV
jgi:hypothetical protein